MHNHWLYYIRYAGAFFAIGGSVLLLAVAIKAGKKNMCQTSNQNVVVRASFARKRKIFACVQDLSEYECLQACMDYLSEQARLREEVVQASKVFIM